MKTSRSLFLFSVFFILASIKAQLTFTITNLSNSSSITCGTPTVKLVAGSNYTVSPVYYIWISPQATSINTTSLGVTNSGTYTVSATAGSLSTSQTLAIGMNTTAPGVTITSMSNSVTCLTPTVSLLGLCNVPNFWFEWITPGPQQPLIVMNPWIDSGGGTYTFIARSPINGCSSSATVQVYENRIYPMISSPPPFLVTCPDGTVSISPFINGNTSILSFSWNAPANATVTGLNTSSLTTNAPGNYTVTVTNNLNGCATRTLINVYACVGLDENMNAIEAKVFPNPVEDKLKLEFSNQLPEDVKLSIHNSMGQLVYSKQKFDLKSDLDVSFLKIGVFFLKIESDNGFKIFKIVKE